MADHYPLLTPVELEKTEKIKQMGGQYSPTSTFTLDEQLSICQSIEGEHLQNNQRNGNNGLMLNGNVSGTYKRQVNSELSWDKSNVIPQLEQCNSDTPQIKIAALLEELFKPWPSKDGYWLQIARTYTARVINWVVADTAKQISRGAIKKTPAHYFTYRIFRRTKRKA